MIVDPTHWGPPSCAGLLCDCCDGVVYESNPILVNHNLTHLTKRVILINFNQLIFCIKLV
jgi:hypothetical protein